MDNESLTYAANVGIVVAAAFALLQWNRPFPVRLKTFLAGFLFGFAWALFTLT